MGDGKFLGVNIRLERRLHRKLQAIFGDAVLTGLAGVVYACGEIEFSQKYFH